MPADVHTRQLRYFLAVAESGSYRHAARQLYVTQPALSRSIKQLEASLGVRLFERSTRGTELTGAGFAIVEPAKRLLESLDRACAQLLPNANAAVTWRIAYAPASIERALGCLVSAITQLWPAQNYVCHEMPQDEVTEAVLTGSCDLGLGIEPAARPGLGQELLGREPLAAAVPHHGGPPGGPLSVDDLRGRDIVLPPSGGSEATGRFVREKLAAAGLAARTGCGGVPEIWRDRTALPEIAFAVLDGSPAGDSGRAGWLVRELPAAFAISHMLYWSAGGDWAQRAEQIVAPARLSWHQLTGLGPVHDD